MPLLRDALARLLQEHEGTPAALQTLAAQRDLAGGAPWPTACAAQRATWP